ncbi:reverse transcriptase domain-containing protein [Tanacetum coccineum]
MPAHKGKKKGAGTGQDQGNPRGSYQTCGSGNHEGSTLPRLALEPRHEHEILRDVEETFRNLRRINMKLNLKKCKFSAEGGACLGHVVIMKGIKACPEKTEVSAEKSLPFFKTQKRCMKKNDFQWIPEAERAFQGIKQCIVELPMVTASRPKEELIMYLYAAREAILSRSENTRRMLKWKFELEAFDNTYRPRMSIRSQVLAEFITERTDEEDPAIEAPAEDVTSEPWTLIMNRSSCLEGSGAGLIPTSPEDEEFTYGLRFEFDTSNNKTEYEALIAGLRITEQIGLKNLIAKVDSRLMENQINRSYEAKEHSMIQYLEKAKALTDNFKMLSIEQVSRSENKKADALSKIMSTSFAHLIKQVLVEILKRKSIEEREVLAIVEKEGYYWMTPLIKYLAKGTLPAKTKKARAIKIKARQYTMINGVLYWKSFLEPWLRCVSPIQAEYIVKEIHEGSCSMHSGPRSVVAKAIRSGYYWPTMHKDARNIIRKCDDCQTHRPVPKNPHQKLTPITSPWPFYKWGIAISGPFPEAQGKVWTSRRNHIRQQKAVQRQLIQRLEQKAQYQAKGTKAVIPVKIGMPSLRCVEINQSENDEGLLLNLDMLEEKREKAAVREARSKAKMEKYYNARVRSTTFRPGDFVYHNNEASHA